MGHYTPNYPWQIISVSILTFQMFIFPMIFKIKIDLQTNPSSEHWHLVCYFEICCL